MRAAEALLEAVKVAAAVDPHATPDEPLLEDIDAVLEARRRLDAYLVKQLQAANIRDVTAELHGRGTKRWLIENQRLSRTAVARLMTVATALPMRPLLADALESGEISVEHAAPIVTTVAKLNPEDRDLSEKILLEASHDLDPDVVRKLCAKTLDASAAAKRPNNDANVRTARGI